MAASDGRRCDGRIGTGDMEVSGKGLLRRNLTGPVKLHTFMNVCNRYFHPI